MSSSQWLMVAFPLLTGPQHLDLLPLDVILSKSTYMSTAAFGAAYASLDPIWPGVCLSMLFMGSTAFTEGITKRKYSVAYGAYQKRVGMFLPIGTVLSGLYLQVTGEKAAIEKLIWPKKGSKTGKQNGSDGSRDVYKHE
jgi:hypothetical protein